GAAVVEGVLPQPEIAEQRIPVLTALLTAALPNAGL
ncbi:MAG TPA: TetR/AcrR family transcriptional regulator, partial [Mycobacterium sp.]|nr:TetR/AcrR family transcriptional regulator [Mycobacterium sp.]